MTQRRDVTFLSGGVQCAAWLYLPDASAPAPVVVMGHGLGATREMRLAPFAERLQAAGYAVLVFDYRHFGDSGGEPRQLLDVGRELEDWAAAIAHVRGRDDVDASRVVLWGTSFGGGHAIRSAADDGAVAAVIAQCPFTDGLASALAIPPLTSVKVTAQALRDTAAAAAGRGPVTIPLAGEPGSTAMMTAPDVVEGYLTLMPEDREIPNAVAARIALQILRYFPGRSAAKLTCPALFQVCERDSVAPAKATLRHVRKAPRGDVRLYDEGHFDIYRGAAFERVVTDQVEFLRGAVPVTA